MNESEYNELREASWRRKLSPAEEHQARAYWAAHVEAQLQWEEDLALTRQLQELPDVPVPSNFTSLVLQAVDAETENVPHPVSPPIKSWSVPWWRRFAPGMAVGALAVGLGVGLLFQQRIHNRKVVAGDMREFMHVAALPGPEVFEDFEAIQKLQPVTFSSDADLVAALQ